jgi:hypothetical protein
MASPAQRWSELSSECISLEGIRKLHTPSSHFRVSPNRYPAGTTFPGSSMTGRVYVLSGHCVLRAGQWRVELVAGTYADFPAGPYEFQVLGDQGVELVNVYEIPERYRAQSGA